MLLHLIAIQNHAESIISGHCYISGHSQIMTEALVGIICSLAVLQGWKSFREGTGRGRAIIIFFDQ